MVTSLNHLALECDFDPEKRTIHITKSSAHSPKTIDSDRVIPLPDIVYRSIDEWIRNLKVRHSEGFLFCKQEGLGSRKIKSI